MKILVVVGKLDRWGTELYLLSLLEVLLKKYSAEIEVFVKTSVKPGSLEHKFKELGCKIVTVSSLPYWKNFALFNFHFYRLLKRNKYDVVHLHLTEMNGFFALACLMANIKNVISHSHNDHTLQDDEKSLLWRWFQLPLLKLLIRKACHHKIAVSKKAGTYLYGDCNSFEVIPSSISIVERHNFNKNKSIHFCSVGRLVAQKNHLFLVETFEYLVHTLGLHSIKLDIIGDGYLKNDLQNRITVSSLNDNIKIIGQLDNVHELLLSKYTHFLFPSIFEGLGIALVEAQVFGLKCIVSDRIVPEAIIIPENVTSLNLVRNVWGDYLFREVTKPISGSYPPQYNALKNSKLDIDKQCQRLAIIYGLQDTHV